LGHFIFGLFENPSLIIGLENGMSSRVMIRRLSSVSCLCPLVGFNLKVMSCLLLEEPLAKCFYYLFRKFLPSKREACNLSSSLLFFFLALTSSFSIRFVVFGSPYLGGMIVFLSTSSNFTEIIGHDHYWCMCVLASIANS
jgi:hypothetical protein